MTTGQPEQMTDDPKGLLVIGSSRSSSQEGAYGCHGLQGGLLVTLPIEYLQLQCAAEVK